MKSIKKPFVGGIAATDADMNICYGEIKDLQTIGRYFDNSLSVLDLKILREYVKSMKHAGAIFVMGENVRKDMDSFFKNYADDKIIIANHYDLSELPSVAYNEAYMGRTLDDPRPICVLGGRSVYDAFTRVYDEFIHTRFETTAKNGKKPLVGNTFSTRFKATDIIFSSQLGTIYHHIY